MFGQPAKLNRDILNQEELENFENREGFASKLIDKMQKAYKIVKKNLNGTFDYRTEKYSSRDAKKIY